MSEVAVREMSAPFTPTFIDEAPERRKSARVPAAGPIRVGPPHREPHARLSATDLSTGGMFIDADRPVRVGARFCAEIVLSDGRHLYIPEAEVAYNRDRPHGAGFGVRFLELSRDARRLLEEEIARLARGGDFDEDDGVDIPIDDEPHPTMSVPPLASEAPTSDEVPAETMPVAIDRRGGATPVDGAARRRRTDLWSRIRHEARAMAAQLPSLWLVLAGLGAALLVAAVGLVVWAELSPAPRVVTRQLPPTNGLSAETHQRLMGENVQEELPPLAPLTPPDALAPAPRSGSGAEADAPPSPDQRAEPSEAPSSAPGKTNLRGTDPAREDSAGASQPTAPEASPPDASAAAPLPPGAAAIGRVDLPDGARVKRTSRLKAPARFVVDVVGLEREPAEVDVDASRIERVRFGRHDGFGRLVFDLTASTGRLTHRIEGGALRVIELD